MCVGILTVALSHSLECISMSKTNDCLVVQSVSKETREHMNTRELSRKECYNLVEVLNLEISSARFSDT